MRLMLCQSYLKKVSSMPGCPGAGWCDLWSVASTWESTTCHFGKISWRLFDCWLGTCDQIGAPYNLSERMMIWKDDESNSLRFFAILIWFCSGPEKGVITKGVFSLEESLESLKFLDSLESLENGRILLYFPQSGGSLKSLESLNSLESLENGLFWKDPFSKRPLFPNPICALYIFRKEWLKEVRVNFVILGQQKIRVRGYINALYLTWYASCLFP